jgi:isopentenyl-diphosphate Delta-isomerase
MRYESSQQGLSRHFLPVQQCSAASGLTPASVYRFLEERERISLHDLSVIRKNQRDAAESAETSNGEARSVAARSFTLFSVRHSSCARGAELRLSLRLCECYITDISSHPIVACASSIMGAVCSRSSNHRTMSGTSSRKKDHVDLCVNAQVGFLEKTTGLEYWDFVHNALPELDISDIDTSVIFLRRGLSMPLLISGMTGGYEDAERINGDLAEVCQDLRIAIGAGSMRQALENNSFHASWRILRKNAPDVPVLANIGAAEVARMPNAAQAEALVDLLQADALVVHSNPLQEFLQPEGDTRFRGVLEGLHMLCSSLDVPVMLKEVGAGISPEVAQRVRDVGVQWIDVAGAGGTSWAGVEMLRRDDDIEISPAFREWGIPTAEALEAFRRHPVPDLGIIASGGIADGLAIAKCIALGADMAASARPLLTALFEGGIDALHRRILGWKHDLTGAMFLTGSASLAELQRAPLIQRQILST